MEFRVGVPPHMSVILLVLLSVFALVPRVLTQGRDRKTRMIAEGYAVSFFADMVVLAMGGSWLVTHFFPSAQLGLWAFAAGSFLVPALLFSLTLLGPYDSMGLGVVILGSVAVIGLSRGTEFYLPLLVYCGLGSALYVGLALNKTMAWYYPYQAVRVASMLLFLNVVRHADA